MLTIVLCIYGLCDVYIAYSIVNIYSCVTIDLCAHAYSLTPVCICIMLYLELMTACFALERAICPNRLPSTTIAINRHAQFLPHRDSGAGNGQSSSLIVGLGDYSGGELVADTVPHDIRYRPLEFDGWGVRHHTLPFCGERYSLVWFTPLGVQGGSGGTVMA